MKDLSMHIMDIFQNSVSASASLITLDIVEDTHDNLLRLDFTDNGKGMTIEMAKKVTDPFFTTRKTRNVGLGLPLLKQNAERTGGFFKLESEEGKGTKVTAQFVRDHLDRPVFGDIPGAILLTVIANPDIVFTYSHKKDEKKYYFSTLEVKEALGDVPLNDPLVYHYLHEMITENLNEIGVSLSS
ncbi:MAG: ATP-binding protein [Bacteroidales bacterium]|nr:ATP-binding protein [Bacteroidales bacterium]